jgi:hypothetical protein
VLAILGPQGAFGLQLAKHFEHLGVFERIATLNGGLVGIGPGLPLLAGLALECFDFVDDLARIGIGDGRTNGIGQVLLRKSQGEVITLEKQLGVGGFGFAVKALFGDGLNLADAVLRVVDCVAFTNVNGNLLDRLGPPVRRLEYSRTAQAGVDGNWAQNLLRKNNILHDFWLFSNTVDN